ncbi:SurA N-terminal domain-containing protein [Methylophilaceae bacterium Uisw_099_01]
MINKVTFIFAMIVLQNIFLINPVLSAQKYIEVDKIVAIVETRSITKLELDKKKEKIEKALSQQGKGIPTDKEITKLSIDQLITEKLVIEYALMQGISISGEQLNNVLKSIAKSNNLSSEEFIKEIEKDGSSYSDFREDIRIQLLFDQIKKESLAQI